VKKWFRPPRLEIGSSVFILEVARVTFSDSNPKFLKLDPVQEIFEISESGSSSNSGYNRGIRKLPWFYFRNDHADSCRNWKVTPDLVRFLKFDSSPDPKETENPAGLLESTPALRIRVHLSFILEIVCRFSPVFSY